MFRLMYRQRRRILFSGFFIWLAVTIDLLKNPDRMATIPNLYWPLLLISVAIVCCGVMLCFALYIAVFPNWRHIVEMLSVYMVVNLHGIEPLYGHLGLAQGFSPLVFFGGFMLFWHFTYGSGLDRFRAQLSWRSRRATTLPLRPDQLWPKFETRPGAQTNHWSPLLRDVVPDQEEPDTFEVSYIVGTSVFEHQTQTVLASDPNRHFRYHFMGDVNPANRGLAEGVFDVKISPDGDDQSRIVVEQTQDAMLPSLALQIWFDDMLGDRLDGLKARLSGKRDWSISGRHQRQVLKYS